MMTMRKRQPADEEDDLSGLVDAKMGLSRPISSQPSTPSIKPTTPVAPRQNFGAPTPVTPTPQRPPVQAPRVPPREGVTYAPQPLPAQTTVTTAPSEAVTRAVSGADRYIKPAAEDAAAAAVDDDAAALDALAAQLDSTAAQNQAGAAAKAGLGGFGLSGGSAAMAADIGSADARNRVLALQDLANAQKDQAFQDVQRAADLADLEDQMGVDVNGDGKIGFDAFDPNAGESDGNPNADNEGGRTTEAAGVVDMRDTSSDYSAGVKAVVDYSNRHKTDGKGDYSGLPSREPRSGDVDMGVLNGAHVWYDPTSGELFTSG